MLGRIYDVKKNAFPLIITEVERLLLPLPSPLLLKTGFLCVALAILELTL